MDIKEWHIYYYERRSDGLKYILAVPHQWSNDNYDLYFSRKELVSVHLLEHHAEDLVLIGPASRLEKIFYGV